MSSPNLGRGSGPLEENGASLSKSLDQDGTFVRDSVYKYMKAGQKNIDAATITNVLRDVCHPMVEQNQRMDRLEVKINSLLTVVSQIAANSDVTNRDSLLKLDKMESKVKKIAGFLPKIANVVTDSFDSFQAQIDDSLRSFDNRVAAMERLQIHHLLKINEREQRSRGWACRVHNFSVNLVDRALEKDVVQTADGPPGSPAAAAESSDSGEPDKKKSRGKSAEERIYECLILPALRLAVEAGDMDELPRKMKDCIEMAHRLPSRNGKSATPAFIFRFCRRPDLFSFLKHKMIPIKSINDAIKKIDQTMADKVRTGVQRDVRVGADLTDLNRQLLTWLHQQDEILYSKISGNRVIYQRKDRQGTWWTCLNPFARTVDQLHKPPADVTQFLFNTFDEPPPFLQTMGRPNPARRLDFSAGDADESTLAGGGVADRGAYDGGPNRVFSGGRGSVGRFGGFMGARARNGAFSNSKVAQQLASIRRQFDEEVCRLGEDLDLLRESQESVINSAASIAQEIQLVLEDGVAQEDPDVAQEDSDVVDDSEDDSSVAVVAPAVKPPAGIAGITAKSPAKLAVVVPDSSVVVVAPAVKPPAGIACINAKSPAKLAVEVSDLLLVKSPAKITKANKKAAKSPVRADNIIAEPADIVDISNHEEGQKSPPKVTKKNTRGAKKPLQ